MNCSCEINSYDCDCEVSEYRSWRYESVKDHCICTECGSPIKKGDMYKGSIFMCEGEYYTESVCSDCLSVIDVMFDGSYMMKCVWVDVSNYIDDNDIPESCISKLTPKSRGKVCDMIEGGV